MSSTIIELRQKDACSVSNNGDYTVDLGNSLLLQDGDEVIIKNVYIDTKQDNKNTNRVLIDDSNDEFHVLSSIYLKDFYTNADFTFNDMDGQGIVHPDGHNYVLSYGFAGRPAGRRLLTMTIVGGNNTGEGDSFDTTLLYQTPAGKDMEVGCRIEVSKHNKDVQVLINGSPNLNLDYKPFDINVEFNPNEDVYFSNNTKFDDNNVFLDFDNDGNLLNVKGVTEELVSGDTMEPVLFEVRFDIPQGSYEPESLAKYITDKLSAQKWTQTKPTPINITATAPIFEPIENPNTDIYVSGYATKSPFITSIKQLQTDPDYAMNQLDNIYFMREDGKSIMEIDPNSASNYILGANQMSLVYDDSLNKFVFQQLHSPILSGAGDAVQSSIVIQENTGGNFFTATALSGVMFTAPYGTKTNNLFYNIMGFSPDNFAPPKSTQSRFDFGTITATAPLSYNLIEGTNITGALKSIDDFFVKDAATYKYAIPLQNQTIIIDNLNSIVGNQTKGQGAVPALKFGYYLIEVSGLPETRLTNSTLSNKRNQKIKSIVGRYYATQDYTEDTGAGSLAVKYSGISQYIDTLSVRILNPDNSLASVGSDNTIFIEVIKANS